MKLEYEYVCETHFPDELGGGATGSSFCIPMCIDTPNKSDISQTLMHNRALI